MRTRHIVLLAITLLAPVALAQAPATTGAPPSPGAVSAAKPEPYHVVTTRDGVELWSGAGTFYYPTASLKAGARLKVIGEDSGYLQVLCPDEARACIGVENAAADASGKTLKVSKLNSIKHVNMRSGVPFARVPFAEKEPQVGAELRVLDTMKSGDGKPTYYVVAAPAGATAFVNKEQVRKLTPEEAAAKPAPGAVGAAAPGGLTAPTPPTAAPSGAQAPAEITPAVKPIEPMKADPRKSDFDALVETFKRVQAQPAAEAEFEPAITQFNAAIAKLGDSPADRRLAQRLGNYLEVLKLRAEVRNSMKSAAESKTVEQGITKVTEELANIERQGFFKVIGRLLPSTVYDGTRLPKLYRVISPEPGSGRTLAYIIPAPGLDLDAKLGRIVGVAGESKMDESLKANLVTPKRVEVITLTPSGATEIDATK